MELEFPGNPGTEIRDQVFQVVSDTNYEKICFPVLFAEFNSDELPPKKGSSGHALDVPDMLLPSVLSEKM